MSGSPLANPSLLPLLGIEALLEHNTTSTLVVAPHPDDETLGCGGAIALLQHLAHPVKVLVVSDGIQSHPNSRRFPAAVLRAVREQETLAAMTVLGVAAEAVTFLRLPDGAVPTAANAQFSEALSRCQSYLFRLAPTIVFLPWRHDPHRDHRATWQLLQAAIDTLSLSPRLLEYPIWDWDPQQRRDMASVRAWRLDIGSVCRLKQQAIAQYRSQTTDLIDDDPEGFRLTPEMLANFAHPWEIYLESG
ncbi:MAG: PIG-L deacetylase family protein [Cyanophyceae cyanobacterium]